MAKFKEELAWVALSTDGLSKAQQAKHKLITDAFAQLKLLKADFEQDVDASIVKNASKLPADVKDKLRIDAKGNFPNGSVRKFSYMRGVAVATATAAKAKSSGISLA